MDMSGTSGEGPSTRSIPTKRLGRCERRYSSPGVSGCVAWLLGIAGVAPIPALKRSAATSRRARATKVATGSRPSTRAATSSAARPMNVSHTTSDDMRMAAMASALGGEAGQEKPQAIFTPAVSWPAERCPPTAKPSSGTTSSAPSTASTALRWRNSRAVSSSRPQPASRAMQRTKSTTTRRWLPVFTIGRWRAISGKGHTPSTTASATTPKTATPKRRRVGRAIRATAPSASGSAPT